MKASHVYDEDEWLVHAYYGVGQVKGIEAKEISGARVDYVRIQTADSTFWVPVTQMDSEKLRPVSTLEEIQLVMAVLQRPAKAMSPDYKVRKARIAQVQLENMPQDIARLIRDLRARQLDRGKYDLDEINAVRTLRQRLIDEWCLVTGETVENVAANLDALLGHQP
jgi:RNA polymerase-interacting CarD/CdnL/TRCF family regulator